MSIRKHMSPKEFDAFQRERYLKELEKAPKGEKGVICGCLYNVYFTDNMLVECAQCRTPLYVRPWVYEVAKERSFPILCQFCVPPPILKGRMVQDIAAVLQHTGET